MVNNTIQAFILLANDMFPVPKNVRHSITLNDENKLQANIFIKEFDQFWFVCPDNDDEWLDFAGTLTAFKTSIDNEINKMEKQ